MPDLRARCCCGEGGSAEGQDSAGCHQRINLPRTISLWLLLLVRKEQHEVTWSSWPGTDRLLCRCSFLSPWFRSTKAANMRPLPSKTNGRMKGAKKRGRWHWMRQQFHSSNTSHLPFLHKHICKETLLLISKFYSTFKKLW